MRIGIDPGIGGAFAIITESNLLLCIGDMPVMAMGKKNQVNAAALSKELEYWRRKYEGSMTVYLEKVSAMPKQGVVSMFNFGVSFGIVQGVLAALSLPMVLVPPAVWKKRCGLIGKEKDMARTLAQQLYPTAELGRKKDIGRADALLIARFGEGER